MPATAGAYLLPRSTLPLVRLWRASCLRSLHASKAHHLGLLHTASASRSPLATTRTFHSSVVANLPPTAETASYRFNHVMIRVKDPKVSLEFYENVLGMDLIDRHDASDFSLYFLAYQHQKGITQRGEREAILELTHNHGTENDANFAYHNGNNEPKGFGHLCIAVDDIQQACQRFEKLGVKFQKRLTDGKMKNIAFILDPDNYWIEIISTSKPQ